MERRYVNRRVVIAGAGAEETNPGDRNAEIGSGHAVERVLELDGAIARRSLPTARQRAE